MKSKLMSFISIVTIIATVASLSFSAFAAESSVVSHDEKTGITVYRDAAGGIVISGMPVPFVATEAQQMEQQARAKMYNENQSILETRAADYDYVDYEYNPIYIGEWSNGPDYARHTLGSYNATEGYLTSYGYCSWYDQGKNALPYRNGASNNGANQGVVDVAKFSYFSIRDLTTDMSTDLQITDWGPSQNIYPDRIADINKNSFLSLHGNTGDGLFYCRTWVPVTNYNP